MNLRQNYAMMSAAHLAASVGNMELASQLYDKLDPWFHWWAIAVHVGVPISILAAFVTKLWGWW